MHQQTKSANNSIRWQVGLRVVGRARSRLHLWLIFATVGALCVSSGWRLACADEISFVSPMLAPTSVPAGEVASTFFSMPMFDPTLGTLTGMHLSAVSNATFDFPISDVAGDGTGADWYAAASFDAAVYDTSVEPQLLLSWNGQGSANGRLFEPWGLASVNVDGSATAVISDPLTLTMFTAANSGSQLPLRVQFVGNGFCTLLDGLIRDVSINYDEFKVTYFYEASTESVPTPSALAALFGMGATGLIGVARKRKRAAV